MIWRIRERDDFARLAGRGRRVRAGVLWCTYLLDESAQPPRLAFAIGRACGPAVARNRLRRRLRSLVAGDPLPPGWYLIGATPAATASSYGELQFDLTELRRRFDAAHSSG